MCGGYDGGGGGGGGGGERVGGGGDGKCGWKCQMGGGEKEGGGEMGGGEEEGDGWRGGGGEMGGRGGEGEEEGRWVGGEGQGTHLRTDSGSSLVKLQFMTLVLTAVELRSDFVHWIQFGMNPALGLSGTSETAEEEREE